MARIGIASGIAAMIAACFVFVVPILKSEKALANDGYMGFTSGSYTGDGVDDKAITGLPFQPDMVMIKAAASYYCNMATQDMPVGYSKNSGGPSALLTNRIKSLTADGFTVGTANEVNTSGTVYHWVAMQTGSLEMSTGKYTGDGSAGRDLTGIGFWPDWVWVFGAEATNSFMRSGYMPEGYTFTGSGNSNRITALIDDGFTVGSHADVNEVGTEYYYVTFKSGVNTAYVGTYDGDGTDDRDIAAADFLYGFIMIKAHYSYDTRWKTASVPGNQSLRMSSSYSASEESIYSMGNGSFRVMDHTSVNRNNRTYSYLAFQNWVGGDPLPVSLTRFKAKADQKRKTVTTIWQTASEVNNDHFTVERSADGIQFESIARIPGNGTTTQANNYSFTDDAPVDGTSYYRLRQVDFNGNFETYGPVSVSFSADRNRYSIDRAWPNPFTDMINLSLTSAPDGPSHMVSIMDVNGRKVHMQQYSANYGNHIQIKDLDLLPRGVYFVKIAGGTNDGDVVKLVKT